MVRGARRGAFSLILPYKAAATICLSNWLFRKQLLIKASGSQVAVRELQKKLAGLIGKGLNFHPNRIVFYKLGPILAFSGLDFCFGIFHNAMMGVA